MVFTREAIRERIERSEREGEQGRLIAWWKEALTLAVAETIELALENILADMDKLAAGERPTIFPQSSESR